jgi:hypothetical protein
MSTDLSKACRSSFGDRGPGSAPAPTVDNNDAMPSWSKIEQDSPDFALRVRGCFDAGTNKTLATLRRDGAPRISASETEFSSDGEITVGMMSGSTKLLDVRRDPRIALHSPTLQPPKDDPGSGLGDAKMSGSLIEIRPPADTPYEGAGFFKLDITEVVLTYVGTPADHLVIESWHAERGWERRTRT